MKKATIILTCVLATVTVAAQKPNFTINGISVPKHTKNGTIIRLSDEQTMDSVASGVVRKGKFTIEGYTDTVFVGWISGTNNIRLPIVVEPGMNATLDARNYIIEGTPLNDQMNRFVHGYQYYRHMRDHYYYSFNSKMCDLYQDSMNYFNRSVAWQILDDNAGNVVGAYMMSNIMGLMVESGDYYHDAINSMCRRADSIYATASPVVRNYLSVRKAYERGKHQKSVAKGNRFVDFNGIDRATHETVSLSQLIAGHVAIVDFWASWCGPCRQEIKQYLKPLYEKYADSGLVIVGVGVWDSEDEFDDAIKKVDIPYPQIIDLAKASPTLYGFTSIPQVFLIDSDGTMLGNFRGEGLVREVEKALQEK